MERMEKEIRMKEQNKENSKVFEKSMWTSLRKAIMQFPWMSHEKIINC